MIILDTNILSELMKKQPNSVVVAWLDGIPVESVWITSITVFEARFGLSLLPAGRRKIELEALFNEVLLKDFENRILYFDQIAAEKAAVLAAERQKSGMSVAMRDTFIAGIVLAKKAMLATRNLRHFNDLGNQVVNPWEAV